MKMLIQDFLQKQWSLDLNFSRILICGAARPWLLITLTYILIRVHAVLPDAIFYRSQDDVAK